MRRSRIPLRLRPRLVLSAALIVGLSVASLVTVRALSRRPATLVGRVAAERLPRTLVPMLSVETEHRTCLPHSASNAVPAVLCPANAADPSKAVGEIQAAAYSAAEVGDADGLHAAVLLDLLGAVPQPERSVDRLRRLVAIEPRSVEVWSDLAAAYLVLAGERNAPLALLQALDAAETACELRPGFAPARFNRALALDLLALDSVASDAWRQYLALDDTSPWAAEARARIAALRWNPPPDVLAAGATAAELEHLAATWPQQARESGWDVFLARWGGAELAGDTRNAGQNLARAEVLGAALERRGGDASLADAVRAIRGHSGDAAATRRLAEAHALYGRGREAFRRGDFDAADTPFAKAYALRGVSSPLDGWTQAAYAATRTLTDHPAPGERLARALAGAVDTARYPALGARARWVLGTTLAKGARSAEAGEPYLAAAALFRRAGERENAAAVEQLIGETQGTAGKREAGYASLYDALLGLRPYRTSVWLHNTLVQMAINAANDGLYRAASRLSDENVVVSSRNGVAVHVVEARQARAWVLVNAGRFGEARRDLAEIRRLLGRLQGDEKASVLARVLVAEAVLNTRQAPVRANAQLDSALALLREARLPVWDVRAQIQRTNVMLALGRTDEAGSALSKALSILEGGRDTLQFDRDVGEGMRAALNRVVARMVREGHPTAALCFLEQSLAGLGAHQRTGKVPARLPAGRVALRFALADDMVLTWTLRGETVSVQETAVPGRALASSLERMDAAFALGDDAAAARELRRLYGWLIAPVADRLGGEGGEVVVVPDGDFTRVPFDALIDGGGRYFVQSHRLRLVPDLAAAAYGPRTARGERAGGVAFVQDPAFDPERFLDLPRLAGASAEVDSARRAYPVSTLVAGESATPSAVAVMLAGSRQLHFAGHAVSDEDLPDSSFLVLAPEAGPRPRGRLTAAEIARMKLGGLDLVVLSACTTLRGTRGGGSGFAGLSGAFLAAGAGGVVGSLWSVDDRATAALMAEFHRRYRAAGDAAGALRDAKLALLASRDGRLRSPSAWAAFEYAGY